MILPSNEKQIFFKFLRIPCDIDKATFRRDYVDKRRVVMLLGCTDNWPAKDWTIEGTTNYWQIDSKFTVCKQEFYRGILISIFIQFENTELRTQIFVTLVVKSFVLNQ